MYQDPEQVSKTRENNSDSNISKITTYRPIHLLQKAPTAEMIHVLHYLNMSTLHKQSQQFKYSTIGDVGKILWGSFRDAKTIDFKSKLAENVDSMAVNKTNLNVMKPKLLKRIQKVSVVEPKITTTEKTTMVTECRGKKNITPVIDTMKTPLSTTENLVDSTEHVRTEIMVESITNQTDSIETLEKELDHTHSTSSRDDKRFIDEVSHKTADLLSDSVMTRLE